MITNIINFVLDYIISGFITIIIMVLCYLGLSFISLRFIELDFWTFLRMGLVLNFLVVFILRNIFED